MTYIIDAQFECSNCGKAIRAYCVACQGSGIAKAHWPRVEYEMPADPETPETLPQKRSLLVEEAISRLPYRDEEDKRLFHSPHDPDLVLVTATKAEAQGGLL